VRAHQDIEIEDLHADLEYLARLLEDQKLKNVQDGRLLQGAQEELERMHEVMEQMNGRMRALQREARERADCVALLSQKLGSLHEELARKEEEWSRKRIFLQSRGFDTQHETCARRLNLAEAAKKLASQKLELDELRMEHDKCPAVIARLRKQMWDTKDALEMDYDLLQGSAGMLLAELPLPPASAASGDDACAAEHPVHQASTLSVILSMRTELAHTRMAHGQHVATLASKDLQIEELNAGLVHLDKSLTRELCGRLALAEQVAKLEDMLVVTEQKLQKHRQSLCACLARKEAKMATMRQQLATMRQQLAEADQRHALLSGECWV
jgi:hypothetical protein